MKPLLLALMLVVAGAVRAEESSGPGAGRTVVLLHGIGLRSWSMTWIAHTLKADGYRVVNLTYPSRTVPVEQLGANWLPEQLRLARVHPATADFVTHSMGGIVLRAYLRAHPGGHTGRVVMLGPPNHGSEIADHLAGFAPYRWFTGINGPRLGTDARSVPNTLGSWPADEGELGVIAGNRSFNPLFSAWMGAPSDSKVSVTSARLEGMKDFIVVHHSHSFLPWRRAITVQVRTFLRAGRFAHEATLPTNPSS